MKRAILVAGLGFGDEGKGSIVDYLARKTHAGLVVRYNGGSQAAHHVVGPAPDGTRDVTHCFAQIGSGALAGAETYLSRFMMVDPISLVNEMVALQRAMRVPAVMVDGDCPILTPWHKAVNRLRELSRDHAVGGVGRHGSCGMGIGELADDLTSKRPVLYARDLVGKSPFPSLLEDKVDGIAATKELQALHLVPALPQSDAAASAWRLLKTAPRAWVSNARAALASATVVHGFDEATALAQRPDTVIFEGAQGVLLDQHHGVTPPHVTWSDCTFANAIQLLTDVKVGAVVKVGVIRAFHTRHGAGPLPSERPAPQEWRTGEHNGTGAWQGPFRYGDFDVELARHAIRALGGITALALTCVDRVSGPWTYVAAPVEGSADRVRCTHPDPITGVTAHVQAPTIISQGPTAAHKFQVTTVPGLGR